jgi:hypothetical protein
VQVLPDPNMVILRLNSKSLCGDETESRQNSPNVRPGDETGHPPFAAMTLSPGANFADKRDRLAEML